MLNSFIANLIEIVLDAAPWLLLGLIAAGVIKVLLPEQLIERLVGGRGPWPVVKAALWGAPLPLCSCGVLPAALGLRRAGASKGATVSFMIATPETGVDSVSLSYALLGPFMALVRPIAAVLSAIVTGLLVLMLPGQTPTQTAAEPCGQCCGNSCDAGQGGDAALPGKRLGPRVVQAMGEIWDDIVWWLLAGLLLAAMMASLVEPQQYAEWGSGFSAMLVMVLIGIPMYICASASTPVAAGLLLMGLSPGTVLVFLLAGPATNIATLGVVAREMGRNAALLYLVGISSCSIALGLTTDWLVGVYAIDVSAQIEQGGLVLSPWFAAACAVILLFISVPALRRPLLSD